MIKKFFGAAIVAILFTGVSVGQDPLNVDFDLGVLSAGATNITGDTSSFSSECDYFNMTNPLFWGNDIVYQFEVTFDQSQITVVPNTLTGDPDFFILNALDVIDDGNGLLQCTGNVNSVFLDDPTLGDTILVPAGTYYLCAAVFNGAAPTADQAAFDVDLLVAEPIDLGVIAGADEAFNLDTLTSGFDTEIGVYDSAGNLLGENDDIDFAGGITQSELTFGAGLPAGTYFIAVGEFDTAFGGLFNVLTIGPGGGNYSLNYSDQTMTGTIGAAEIAWFQFEVGAESDLFVPPATFTNFRGTVLNASLTDFADADDVDASYNPGFTIGNFEAPVWLIFEAVSASATGFRVESSAGTPGLEYTFEAWNWGTSSYDIIDTEVESFNIDTATEFPIVAADHIEPGTDNVRSRVGWRRVGFTINFPWQVNVDQVGWVQ